MRGQRWPWLLLVLATLVVSTGRLRAADWMEATVYITDVGFVPRILTVPANTRVTWVNLGTSVHSSTDDRQYWDSGGLAPGGIVNGRLTPGQSFSYLFTSYDVWTYHSEPDATWVGGVRSCTSPLCWMPGDGATPGVVAAVVVSGAVSSPTDRLPMPPPRRPTSVPVPPNMVLVTDSGYSPQDLKIMVGDTVVWSSRAGKVHTVTDDAHLLFDSGGLSLPQEPPLQSQFFSYRFTKPGVYAYHSETDADPASGSNPLRGTITVLEAPTPTPTALPVGQIPPGAAPAPPPPVQAPNPLLLPSLVPTPTPAFTPFWVKTLLPGARLWSGPATPPGVSFGQLRQFSCLLVAEPRTGPRFHVWNPATHNYAYVNLDDVGGLAPTDLSCGR